MLETYTTDDVIAEANEDILRFTQLPNATPLQFHDAIWMKTLRVPHVYDEYMLKQTVIERLPTLIIHSMHALLS